jgi:flagellar biosynthesis/type III secretory pathway protein FliH
MPSSHEVAAAARWQPDELETNVVVEHAAPAPSNDSSASVARLPLFEVSTSAGIPEAVLEPARLAAESAGYVAGWNSGSMAAHEMAASDAIRERHRAEQEMARARSEADRAIAALHAAAERYDSRSLPVVDEITGLIVDAAYQIAESLVGTALADDELRGRAAVARAMAPLPTDQTAVVSLSPVDHAVLTRLGVPVGASVTLAVDPALAPGDSYATAGATAVDARISAGLARVRALLAEQAGR